MSVRKDRLISRDDIKERIKLIHCSYTDYISENGNIYKQQGDKFFMKTHRRNELNGYVYCGITQMDGKNKNMRVHKLVALAFVDNPRPDFYTIVGHMDNVKHNNNFENLYWTNNQENTKKAAEDGLNPQLTGINNDSSSQIKVTTMDGDVVGVYGSIRGCVKLIDNLDIGYLSKTLPNNGNYKPLNKKYKYIPISYDEYINTSSELKEIPLIEYQKKKKQQRIFKATNLATGEEFISDNQKRFASEHNIPQPAISYCLIHNAQKGGWKFETIKDISYEESSAYQNLINLSDDVIVENINTNEVIKFKTTRELKDYFGLEGHCSMSLYIAKGHLIHSQWKVLVV